MVATIFIVVWVVLLLVGMILLLQSRRAYRRAKETRGDYGIQEGRITYSDLNKPAQPLFSRRVGLAGKPDYIVRLKGQYIPVEVKTGVAAQPHRSHVLQLAAYCLLLEETHDLNVPFGILVYGDGRQFRIPFGADLRTEVEKTLEEMRARLASGSVKRDHDMVAKCRPCSLRRHCKQRID